MRKLKFSHLDISITIGVLFHFSSDRWVVAFLPRIGYISSHLHLHPFTMHSDTSNTFHFILLHCIHRLLFSCLFNALCSLDIQLHIHCIQDEVHLTLSTFTKQHIQTHSMSDCFPFNNIQVSHCILMHSYVFEMSTFIHIHNTHASIVFNVHASVPNVPNSQCIQHTHTYSRIRCEYTLKWIRFRYVGHRPTQISSKSSSGSSSPSSSSSDESP